MTKVCPATQLDSLLASQTAALAMSTGNPNLPIGNPSANQGSTISDVKNVCRLTDASGFAGQSTKRAG
jgi:hypothetical protein